MKGFPLEFGIGVMGSKCLLLCLAPSTSKVTRFSPNHHHLFLKYVNTIAIYLDHSLILYLLFLTCLYLNFTPHIHLHHSRLFGSDKNYTKPKHRISRLEKN